jgi:ABC-type Mn2+/Zn2+ transport system ATPase subunit
LRALLELRTADVGYRGAVLLAAVDLALGAGEVVVLRGPSGGGKSTLVHTALGLLEPLAGEVLRTARRAAWVPQQDRLDDLFPVDVTELVTSGGVRDFGWSRRPGRTTREHVHELLQRLDLVSHARRPLAQLSGGQRQRALVARALAAKPDLLVLDEPTSALDETSAAEVVALVHEAALHGAAVLVATHQHELFTVASDATECVRRYLVSGGRVVEEARPWT